MVIVGIPTLVATAIITVNSEAGYRLWVALPGVAFPVATWLGVGNIVSAVLPVAALPWRERWAQRRGPAYGALGGHLGLPYALLLAVDPVGALPRMINRSLPAGAHSVVGRGATLVVVGLLLYAVGTGVALLVAHYRDIRL